MSSDVFAFHAALLGNKQGRIHGNPVADGWPGAEIPKPHGIQKCDEQMDQLTYRPAQQDVETRVRDKKEAPTYQLINHS